MKLFSAIVGGVAGALALTLIHETTRRITDKAPRMDLLGIEALENTLEKADVAKPDHQTMFNITMAGDIISNAAYYSLIGIGAKKWVLARGGILGLAAGLGAVYLPKHLGLHQEPSNRTCETKIMTTALYLSGGLIAAAAMNVLENFSD